MSRRQQRNVQEQEWKRQRQRTALHLECEAACKLEKRTHRLWSN